MHQAAGFSKAQLSSGDANSDSLQCLAGHWHSKMSSSVMYIRTYGRPPMKGVWKWLGLAEMLCMKDTSIQ